MLEYLDMFGYKPVFFVNGRDSGRTKLGGIMLIFTALMMISLLVFYAITLLKKSNPIVLLSNQYDDVMPVKVLNDNEFTFPFALEDPLFTPIVDTSIYFVKSHIVRIRQEGNLTWEYTPFNVSSCSKSKGQLSNTQINEEFLNKLLCAEYNEHTLINSSYEKGDYTSLQFEFFPCTNSTDSDIVCKPQEEIQRILNNTILLGQYLNFDLFPQDFHEPTHYRVENWFTAASMNYFKQIEVFIQQYEISSDIGLIFEDIMSNTYLKVDYIKELFYSTPSTNGAFLRFIFRYSNNKTIINRKYVRLQNTLVELGGFLKFFTFISIIINFLFSKHKYYEMLINQEIVTKQASLLNMSVDRRSTCINAEEQSGAKPFKDNFMRPSNRPIRSQIHMKSHQLKSEAIIIKFTEWLIYYFAPCLLPNKLKTKIIRFFSRVRVVEKLMDLPTILTEVYGKEVGSPEFCKIDDQKSNKTKLIDEEKKLS